MSSYVLILFLMGRFAGSGALAIDMPSEEACKAAYAEMYYADGRPNMWGFCMKRNSK